MGLERGGVVAAVVAEQFAELLQAHRIGIHVRLPVPVTGLVTDVAHRGAVRLAHPAADPFELGGVCLADVEGDYSAGVPDGDGILVGAVAQHEAQQGVGVGRCQIELQQLPHHPALCGLERRDLDGRASHLDVGGARDALAQGPGHPVAAPLVAVHAGVQREAQIIGRRVVGDLGMAVQAGLVFEEDPAGALRTREPTHLMTVPVVDRHQHHGRPMRGRWAPE